MDVEKCWYVVSKRKEKRFYKLDVQSMPSLLRIFMKCFVNLMEFVFLVIFLYNESRSK